MTTLSLSFAAVNQGRASAVMRFLGSANALAGGAAVDGDLGLLRGGSYLVGRVRLAEGLASDAILERLRFWCARAGGHAALLDPEVAAECGRRLDGAEISRRGVPAPELGVALGAMLAELGGPRLAPVADDELPVLSLRVWGPGWSGVTYDREKRALFIPTPLAPPPGDELTLQLETTSPVREVARARARVTDVVAPGRGDASTAGFTAVMLGSSDALHRVLAATSAAGPGFARRRAAQRFATSAPIVLGGDGPAALLADISDRGAFIRTRQRAPVGSSVHVEVRLPNDTTLATDATVIRATPEGLGVEFRPDPGAHAALASAVTSLAGRRHQVLVVDDDALARKMLADVFKERGYDVLTAPDAEFAMRALADQVFTLDLLVTDVLMPGVDGEQLVRSIRRIGGESDLPILVMSGRVDDALKERLRLAGATAVVAKSLGAESIVRRAEDVIAARARPDADASPLRHAAP